jgi:transcriptional regulator GlxA family with amidase domain
VPPEVHLLDMSGPAHIFYEASHYGAPIESHFISLRGKEELSSAGIHLSQLERYDSYQLGSSDWIFIPGLESHLLKDQIFEDSNKPFFKWLNTQYENGAKVCSVCTGAYLLAQAGLLNGKNCTTHWKYLEDFRSRFPDVGLISDRLFVEDERLYTSAGVSSGIDLALYLLEEEFGPVFATKIAKEVVVYLRRTEDDPQLSVFLQYRNHLDQRVHLVQDNLAQHLDKKLPTEKLAEDVNMSPRNLTRLFKKTTGITIGDYHDKLRVERAVQLLSEGNKVDSVSLSCGLQSSNQLRSLLRKYGSALPHELRNLA